MDKLECNPRAKIIFWEIFWWYDFCIENLGMQTPYQKKLYTMYENSKMVTSPNRN